MRIFAIEEGTIAYATENGVRTILKDINFSLTEGQQIALYAANGSGKTSLLRAITGLDPLAHGHVVFHEKRLETQDAFKELRRAVGFVVQDAADQIFFPRVLEDVVFGPLNLGMTPEAAEERARAVLARLGIASLEQRATHRLSGGELRLVALAGILAMEPEALLLDEPTTALDEQGIARLRTLLKQLPTPRVIVSHDKAFLKDVAEDFYTIEAQHIKKM